MSIGLWQHNQRTYRRRLATVSYGIQNWDELFQTPKNSKIDAPCHIPAVWND